MKVTSVNIGRAKTLSHAKAARPTGIYKRRTDEPVRVTYDGLVGDAICNTKHHGGVDQAVYVYGTPDYTWWSAHSGQALWVGKRSLRRRSRRSSWALCGAGNVISWGLQGYGNGDGLAGRRAVTCPYEREQVDLNASAASG